MTLPAWAPDPTRVAAYIPARAITTDGQVDEEFDRHTNPTGDQVDQLIADGCAWVLVRTGTVDADLEDMAAATAAVWVAAQIELGWPDRAADVDTAKQLQERANRMRDDLDTANAALTGADDTNPAAAVPLYAFPDAPTWADLDL